MIEVILWGLLTVVVFIVLMEISTIYDYWKFFRAQKKKEKDNVS